MHPAAPRPNAKRAAAAASPSHTPQLRYCFPVCFVASTATKSVECSSAVHQLLLCILNILFFRWCQLCSSKALHAFYVVALPVRLYGLPSSFALFRVSGVLYEPERHERTKDSLTMLLFRASTCAFLQVENPQHFLRLFPAASRWFCTQALFRRCTCGLVHIRLR